MLNSYSNFLKFAASRGDAGAFLAGLKAGLPSAGDATVKPLSASSEEIVLENELRDIVGGGTWSNEQLRRLFVAAQPEALPAIYDGKLQAEAMQFKLAGGLDIRVALKKARAVLVVMAPMTAITSDDAAVQLIDAILADVEMLGWFKGKVDAPPAPVPTPSSPAGTLSLEVEPEPVRLALNARGIDWSKAAAAIPIIIQLIRLLRS